METFIERIKKARKAAKLTQGQLAELIGVGRRTVLSYEKGDTDVPVPVAFKIATACNVCEIWLFTGENKNEAFNHTAILDEKEQKEIKISCSSPVTVVITVSHSLTDI